MRSFISMVVISIAGLGVANAQYDFGPPIDYHAMNSSFQQSWIGDGIDDEPSADFSSGFFPRDAQAPLDAGAVAVSGDPARYAFDPERRVRRSVREKFLATMEKASPADADELGKLPLFDMMDGALRAYGLSSSNLADALAVHLIAVLDAANGTNNDAPGRATLEMVQAQAAGLLDASGKAGQSALDRQQLSDELLLQTFVIEAYRNGCRTGAIAGTPSCDGFTEGMRETARLFFGVPPSEVALTGRGFEHRPDDGPPSRSTPVSAVQDGELGACGFPVRAPGDAAGQDVLATMGRCSEYTGAKQ